MVSPMGEIVASIPHPRTRGGDYPSFTRRMPARFISRFATSYRSIPACVENRRTTGWSTDR